jgi:hypothetical protein
MNRILHNPTDTNEQYAEWSANCGPCALAALLCREVKGVRVLFPQYPAKPWCNLKGMLAALASAKVACRYTASTDQRFPERGLAFVQWVGSASLCMSLLGVATMVSAGSGPWKSRWCNQRGYLLESGLVNSRSTS